MVKTDKSEDDMNVIVGRQVRRLRNAAGLTQDVVSERCGIFRTYLSRIECGDANPTVTILVALAGTLSVDVQTLFSKQDCTTNVETVALAGLLSSSSKSIIPKRKKPVKG